MITNKRCLFCDKEIFLINRNDWKKKFCTFFCQQEYWRFKRNKTGDFTRRGKRLLGKQLANSHLSPLQLQICYGGLLGDSAILQRPNGPCRLKMGHCERQLGYLEMKKKLLEPFFIQEKATFEPAKQVFINGNQANGTPFYSYNSVIHQDFTDLFGSFYRLDKGKKRKYINMNILNKTTELSILLWYMDDGTFAKNSYNNNGSYIKLYTYRYSLPEHRTLKRWFWRTWRIECKISLNRPQKQYFLSFNVDNTKLFFSLFKDLHQYIPVCMRYKFPTNSVLPADFV